MLTLVIITVIVALIALICFGALGVLGVAGLAAILALLWVTVPFIVMVVFGLLAMALQPLLRLSNPKLWDMVQEQRRLNELAASKAPLKPAKRRRS